MRKIISQIPNCITLCNLLCGTIAAWQAALGYLQFAAIFIVLGIVFDFFDGLTARLLKVASPIGKELDSLADLVTSGIAPAFILFYILLHSASPNWIAFFALAIPLAAAFRLAKFNLDTRQSHSFLGLPTPANALVWAAIGFCYKCPALSQVALLPVAGINGFLFSPTGCLAMAIMALIISVLMLVEIPLFGLKFKNLRWSENWVKYVFVASSVVIMLLLGVFGCVVVIVWYVILSLIYHATKGGKA